MPPKKKNQRKRAAKSSTRSSASPHGLVRAKPPQKKAKTADEEEKSERRLINISIDTIADSIWENSEVGPCNKGVPVGTFLPDDETLNPEGLPNATYEQVLLHRRVILLNKDSRGISRWALMDQNSHGATYPYFEYENAIPTTPSTIPTRERRFYRLRPVGE